VVNGRFDTAVFIPGAGTHVFADDFVWRYAPGGRNPDRGYPRPITKEFPGVFPRRIDAAFVDPTGTLLLFRGAEYIRYDLARDRPLLGFPRRYADDWAGAPPDRIDAGIQWGPDLVYLFHGDAYTCFSPRAARARPGYPKPIAPNWPGLTGGPVRAALRLPDGRRVLVTDSEAHAYSEDGRPAGAGQFESPVLDHLAGAAPDEEPGSPVFRSRGLLTSRAQGELEAVAAGKVRLGRPFDPPYPTPIHSQGPAVKQIQEALIELGWRLPRFGADGRYGNETYQTVLDYKRRHNVPSDTGYLDGIAGPNLVRSIDTELENQTPPPSRPTTSSAALSSLESRFFPSPGGPDAAPFSRAARFEPIIDGVDYFAAIAKEIDGLKRGDSWFVVGWWVNVDFPLVPGGRTLGDLLVERAAAGVDVRVIVWTNRWLIDNPGLVPSDSESQFFFGSVMKGNIKTAEDLRGRVVSGTKPMSGRVVIDSEPGNPALTGPLDRIAHALRTQHMKFTVFVRSGQLTAYAGGIDYEKFRLTTPMHRGHSPLGLSNWWHDAGVRTFGDAADRILQTFATRWNRAAALPAADYDLGDGKGRRSYNSGILPFKVPHGAAISASTDTTVQVARTVPDDNGGIHEVEPTFRSAIAAATRYIYVEDQYFDAITLLPSIADACRRGVRVIAVTPGAQDPQSGEPAPTRSLSQAVIDYVVGKLSPTEQGNLAVWQLAGMFVHAKLMLIDDEFVSIGSANFADRSMENAIAYHPGWDSELTVAAVNTSTLVSALRVKLWAEHLRVSDPAALADLRDLNKSLAVWRPSWGTGVGFRHTEADNCLRFVGPLDIPAAPASGTTPTHAGSGAPPPHPVGGRESEASPVLIPDVASNGYSSTRADHQRPPQAPSSTQYHVFELEQQAPKDPLAAITVDPFPSALTVTFDPAKSNGLQTCLDQIATATKLAAEPTLLQQRDLQGAATLPAAVVDLVDPTKLAYAGHFDDDTYYVGSLAKIPPMYAAFELRVRVQRAVTEARAAGLDVTKPDWHVPLVKAIEHKWRPVVAAGFPHLPQSFPDLNAMFEFALGAAAGHDVHFRTTTPSPNISSFGEFGEPVGLHFDDWMTLMILWSNNLAAHRVIMTIGHSYLNGLLHQAGLFVPIPAASTAPSDGTGIWVSGSYGSSDWKPGTDMMKLSARGTAHYKSTSNFVGNARQIAKLLTLAATGALFGGDAVGVDACTDIVNLMIKGTGQGTTTFIGDALTGFGVATDSISSKIGLGVASPISGRVGVHDCAIIKRTRADGTVLRYVSVVLGAFARALPPAHPHDPPPFDPGSPRAFDRLCFELDRCVSAAH
jgi:phosphatidylserine/phosphatidylglycerophosphate/cardiolipin synthase-like enzyme